MPASGARTVPTVERAGTFEDLLLEVSTLFISLPADAIDAVIIDTQRRVCTSLGFDLSSLWQWAETEPDLLRISHLYTIPGGPEHPREIDAATSFPWIYRKVLAEKMYAFSNDDLTSEAAVDLRNRQRYGVESTVVIVLEVGRRQVIGILTFETLARRRSFSADELTHLRLVADVFANALVRKRTELSLIEGERRLSLAAESAEAGLWELDCGTGTFWATDQAQMIFEYGPDEVISMERFERSVYPEDLDRVREAIAASFASGAKLDVEYRIRCDSGRTKWICSRGRPFYRRDESPKRMLGVSLDISERKGLEDELKSRLAEVESLKQQLEQENYYLREDLITVQGFEHIIGASREFNAVMTSARQVAVTSATVVLYGETGTGKGVIAHAIHHMSERRGKSFVTVNCAALPASLIESELFGREKGAFTGASATQTGRFEVANGGTIFLDEIGEMEPDIQAKLLRVLQDGEFERLGSPRTVSVDVRVIAATARDLKEDVRAGRFRQDLFYRLNVFPITLPPLRRRREDISLLAQHFVEKYCRKMGKQIDRIPQKTLDAMLNYSWPGNVRELEHLVERGVIVSTNGSLKIDGQLISPVQPESGADSIKDLKANERDHIESVLTLTNWKIEGPGGAAEILDIHPSTLRFRLKKLGLQRPT